MRLPLRSLLVVGLSLLSSRTRAQAVSGVGADATPLSRGATRIRIAGSYDIYDRVFTDSGSQRLLKGLATPALGTRALPQLSAAQTAIRALSGSSTFLLSLGTLEASGDVRQSVTPFALDVGITSKLSVGVVIPYVESLDNALLVLNRAGTGPSVGQNPAYSATSGGGARAVNGSLLRQIASARSQLTAEITRCANAAALNCDAIRANPTAPQQVLQQALETQTALATVYGDSLRGGSPLVPISGSGTQTAIVSRIAALRTSFAGFGITSIAEGAAPSSATVVNGPAAIPRIARDTAYGLNYTTLGGTRRAGIGDVDLTASYLWFNTLGARPAQWLNASTFGVRSMVTAGWRFGTAGADRTDDAFDVPVGSGANALLARSTTDVLFSQRFWASGTLRLVQPLGDQIMARRPLFADTALFMPSIVASAQRTLGRRIEIEIAPRYVINRFFGVSGGYLFRQHSADQYAFAADSTTGAATVKSGAGTYQAYLIGATFSTLGSYIRGRSKWPVEVQFTHVEPLTGSGDAIAAVATDRLEIRVYTGFPRR